MKIKPKFGNAILADSAREQSYSKIDAHGIFTNFLAWGYPATRNWSMVVTAFDLPMKQSTFIVTIKRRGSSEESVLVSANFAPPDRQNESIFNIRLGHRFEREGSYEIICSFKDYDSTLRIPVRVVTQQWPVITERELDILRKNRNAFMNKLAIQISCKNCNHTYKFEEVIIPEDDVTQGSIRIPDDGNFECNNCGHIMKLLDFKGQVRAAIKENIANSLKHSAHV